MPNRRRAVSINVRRPMQRSAPKEHDPHHRLCANTQRMRTRCSFHGLLQRLRNRVAAKKYRSAVRTVQSVRDRLRVLNQPMPGQTSLPVPHHEQPATTKTCSGEKHFLRLIARDQQNQNGGRLSAKRFSRLFRRCPTELVELHPTEEGRGRAQLTERGQSLIDAMGGWTPHQDTSAEHDLVANMRALEADHEPDGWPAVR